MRIKRDASDFYANAGLRELTEFLFQNDADGSGTIDFPEFLSLISKRQREMLDNEVTLKPKFLHFN